MELMSCQFVKLIKIYRVFQELLVIVDDAWSVVPGDNLIFMRQFWVHTHISAQWAVKQSIVFLFNFDLELKSVIVRDR